MVLGSNLAVEVLEEMGMEKKAIETALELHTRGFTDEDIAVIIKMPVEWVKEKLKAKVS